MKRKIFTPFVIGYCLFMAIITIVLIVLFAN